MLDQFTNHFQSVVFTETWQIQDKKMFHFNNYSTIYNKEQSRIRL